jgi:hypothetical protein
MASTTPRVIVIVALATLALVAPPASARPVVRKIPERHAPWRIVTTGGDTSPFDYFIAGVALIAMLGAGRAHLRTSRRVCVRDITQIS